MEAKNLNKTFERFSLDNAKSVLSKMNQSRNRFSDVRKLVTKLYNMDTEVSNKFYEKVHEFILNISKELLESEKSI